MSRFFLFAAYAVVAKVQGTGSLSVSQAISSLSLLFLISKPLSDLLTAIPQGWGALGCFQRIQSFLLEQSRVDLRTVGSIHSSLDEDLPSEAEGVELRHLEAVRHSQDQVSLRVTSFGWSNSTQDIVKDASTRISCDSYLTIVVGPVGCGKSTLLKGLLGETTFTQGRVKVLSSQIAYCDQTPWIINGSIRDNIVSESEFQPQWYQSVVRACALDTDMLQLPEGDSTLVGSQGIKLSGGQKQRLVSSGTLFVSTTSVLTIPVNRTYSIRA